MGINNNNHNWTLNKTFFLFLRLLGTTCPKFQKRGSRHLPARIAKSWPKPYLGAEVTYPNWDSFESDRASLNNHTGQEV